MRNVLRAIATVLLVPILLFEEWGWEPLARQVARLSRLPLWARLEDGLRSLPPWGALLSFALPVIALIPVKLLALYLFGTGHYASGVVLIGGAKLAGTAIVARLFQLVQPTLMRIGWFAHWYPRWTTWRNQVLGIVRQSPPWQAVRALKAATRRRWRALRRRD